MLGGAATEKLSGGMNYAATGASSLT